MSVFSVIFHCIRQNIHHHTFHILRTSNKIPVCDFFFLPHNSDILFCCDLFDHNKYFSGNTAQIKWYFFQHHFSGLQLTHIQNIVYQFQKQMRGFFDFSPAFGLFFHIIGIMVCHIEHATDSIDRGSDIVAHTLEKLSFCLIGGFCLFCSNQKFCFIFFIFFLFLFPVCQIGSVCPEPEYAEHQKIKKDNTCYT